MCVQIYFPPRSSIDNHLTNSLGSFFGIEDTACYSVRSYCCSTFTLEGSIFFCIFYVLCLLSVFYTNHLSDDIDSSAVVISSNKYLLPLDLGYKPPHCVIFSLGCLSYVWLAMLIYLPKRPCSEIKFLPILLFFLYWFTHSPQSFLRVFVACKCAEPLWCWPWGFVKILRVS